MQTYIAILRGVNVSGHNKLPMKELKEMLEELGYGNIATYIQSGNAVFQYKKTSEDKLAAQIKEAIKTRFGHDVPVLVRTVDEMQSALKNNPFLMQKDIDTERLHITFLAHEPEKENITKANTYNYEPDRFIISGREVYVYCPNGYGNTKINNTFFENKLKVQATTRNLKTVRELIKMGEAAGK